MTGRATRRSVHALWPFCWFPLFAVAQADDANTVPGAAGEGTAATPALEIIYVTAQKRSENLQDVALAVTTLDDAGLADAGVADAMQLQLVVPSLTYTATGISGQPYLRGIGTRLSQVGLEPSIATYIDDRYVSRPVSALLDLMDIDHIEVLKGPQGTLYGRNAAGGAIRVITREPGREASVKISGKTGSYDYGTLGLSADGPLSPGLRGQITAGVERRDGFATNLVAAGRQEADDIQRQAYRGKLLWDLSEAASAQLTLSWWQRSDWSGSDLVAAGLPEANRGGALFRGVTSRSRDHFASALQPANDLREAAADLRIDVDFGNLDLVAITTYTDADFMQGLDVDVSSAVLLDLDATERSSTWSQELRLLSHTGGALEWIAGAYYYRQAASNLFLFRDTISAQPRYAPGTDFTNGLQHVDTEAYALYGQAAYAFDGRWALTLGGRWNHESKAATLTDIAGAVSNAPTPYVNADSWSELTPRVALEYRGASGLAYLSYARGFKSGGYNYPASQNPVLKPEILDTYEFGVKADLLQGRLRLNSALFAYEFKDLQVTRGGTGAFLLTDNAANARATGLETDFTFMLSAGLAASGGVALIDSAYSDYTAGVFVPVRTPPYGSAPLPGGLNVRGRSLLRAPDRAAYVALSYEPRLDGGARLPLSLSYSYKSAYYFDFSAIPETEWLRQDPYGIVNARLTYAAASDKWEIGLWGTNLTDEEYYEDAVLTAASSRVSYADPRMYGLHFALHL